MLFAYISSNTNYTIRLYLLLQGCNCKIEVVEKHKRKKCIDYRVWWRIQFPENFYGYNFYERYVDLVKSPRYSTPTM